MSTQKHRDRTNSRRIIHKRASQACQQCRQRKVKCDLTEKGAPCQNCELDEIECTTAISKRSRKYKLNKVEARSTQQSTLSTNPSASLTAKVSSKPLAVEPTNLPARREGPSGAAALSSLDNANPQIAPEQQNCSQQERTTQNFRSAFFSPAQSVTDTSSLSCYFSPTKRKWNTGELEFLNCQDTLSIPDLSLREHLLLTFVLHVYPFLPVLDVQDFLDAVSGKSGTQVSLILFQAVMFAGIIFADLQVLLDAGFTSRIEAREYFYRKVKLLYEFEWESDRIVLIQTILLCQYWYITGNDQKDPWYWLGICKSLAISLGLDRASTYNTKSAKTCRLWRRIWWTCVSRDRITAITTRKPVQIKDEDINIAALSFADFDTKPVMTDISALRESPAMANCVSKMMLADMFMLKIKVLLVTGRMLDKVYTLQGFAGSTSDWATFYMPKLGQDLEPGPIIQFQKEFDQCLATLNDYCRLNYDDAGTDQATSKVLRVHRASLELLRLAAQEALHRPLAYSVVQLSNTADSNRITDDSRAIVCKTATEISHVVRTLHEEDLLGYVPPLSLGCILSAVISHLTEIRLTARTLSDSPNHPIHHCIVGLLSLQDMWQIAERTVQLVRQMIASSHVAYAWNFRMLSRTLESQRTADDDSQHTSYRQTERMTATSSRDLNSETVSNLLVHSNSLHSAGAIDMNNEISPYLALMHPFPGIAPNSIFPDAFSFNNYNLFAENPIETYGPNQVLESGMTGEYPWYIKS